MNIPRAAGISLIISLVIALLYANSLNAPFYFDDYPNIVHNESIRLERADWPRVKKFLRENFQNVRQIPYMTFSLNYLTGGYHPFGYHLFNVAVHCFNAWLIFILTLMTFTIARPGRHGRSEALFASFAVSLTWAIHPIQTNVTTYMVQRMSSLAAMFFLLSFITYIKGRQSLRWNPSRSWFCFASAVLFWALSLSCKRNTVLLPILVLAYDSFFFPMRGQAKKIILGVLACSLLLIGAFWGYGGAGLMKGLSDIYEWRGFTLKERLLTESRVVFLYLGLLLDPNPDRLTLFYDGYPVSKGLFQPWTTAASLFGLVVCLLFIVISASKKRFIYAFGLLWYFVNLTVESTFIPLELVFEHRAYLPSAGIFLAASAFLTSVIKSNPQRRLLIASALLIFCLFESFGTALRNQYWADKTLFYEHTLERAPDSPRVLGNLSLVYRARGALNLSRECLDRALKLEPDNINTLAFYFLLVKSMGDEVEAGKVLDRVDRLLGEGRYTAVDTHGIELMATQFFDYDKDYEKALEYINYALKKNKSYGYYFKQGVSYLNLRRPEEALLSFKKALEQKPDMARYNFYISLTLKLLGRDHDAALYLDRAYRLSPSPGLRKEMDRIMNESGLWEKAAKSNE